MSHGFAEVGLALTLGAVAIAVLYAGYVRYETRVAKAALPPPGAPAPPDPADEMARLNEALSRELGESRKRLDGTREAIRRGTK